METEEFAKRIDTITAQHATRVAVPEHHARIDALQVAQAEVNAAAQRQLALLQIEISAAEHARKAALDHIQQRAAATRQALVAAILAELFGAGDDRLPAMIRSFRVEPGRAVSMRIRNEWLRLAERTEREVGGSLTYFLLALVFADDIIAERALPAAVNWLAGDVTMGCDPTLVGALAGATRPIASPQKIEDSLIAVESAVLRSATRASLVDVVDPVKARRYQLREQHLTHADYAAAAAAFDATARVEPTVSTHEPRAGLQPPKLATGLIERVRNSLGGGAA